METNETRRIRMVYAERDRTHKSIKGKLGRERMLRERGDTMEPMLGNRLKRPLSEFQVLDIRFGKGSWTYPMPVSMPVLRSHYFGLLCPPDNSLTRQIELSDRRLGEGHSYA
jgi:hypothetical protein